ncbi:MAG TPA: ATP-binding protein [Verrucomicrobiae bacterium]|nr:ATP-binding protein [Verrucomicrobiae bacterium]
MKTALLLTNSADTQRLFTETLGEKTNFVLLPPPTDPTRERFDALFTTWLRLADAVILDAASLGEPSRWAIESLATAKVEERQAVVIRLTARQRTLYELEPHWLAVSETESPEQLKQSLGTFFELRDAQAKLKRADAIIARQREMAPASTPAALPPRRSSAIPLVPSSPASASFDSFRYRTALKNISELLSQRVDRQTLWTELLKVVRELFGVGKAAIFTRAIPSINPSENIPVSFSVAASAGLSREVVEHLRLTADAGIGGYLLSEGKILRRGQLVDAFGMEFDPQITREFELLGTEVAVPVLDGDQLLGVLTFSGRITGEALANEELELVYHLLGQIAQALRNIDLHDQMAGQRRLLADVLANVQSGVIVVGEDGRVLNLNRCARELLQLGPVDYVGQSLNRLPSRVADVIFETLQTGKEIRQREVTLLRGRHPLGVSVTRSSGETSGKPPAAEPVIAIALIEDLTQLKLEQQRARELADKEFFTRLAARMSHELKNSLVSIKIFAQLLPERYNEKEFREQFSTTVANEVNRVDVLVNNLTFFAHPLLLVHEEVVLSELIDACLKNITQEFSRKQVAHLIGVGEKAPEPAQVPVTTVKKNFGHKFARLEGDRIRLMQAFEHVLRNAVQSMPQGGRLSISTTDAQPSDFPEGKIPAGGALRIEWQDSGAGIALEDLKRVTEPFVTTRNVGVGLGLTIVKKIVERHGGSLEIDSLLGRGTTVVLLLPLKAQSHPDDHLLMENGSAGTSPDSEKVENARTASDQTVEHG